LNKQRETEDAVAEDLNVVAAAKAGARLSVRLDSHQPSPTRCSYTPESPTALLRNLQMWSLDGDSV